MIPLPFCGFKEMVENDLLYPVFIIDAPVGHKDNNHTK